MKKLFILTLLVAVIIISALNILKKDNPLLAQAEEWCMDEHVDQVEVNATLIKTISNLPGGGLIYFRVDGSAIVCPVISPDSESQECKDAGAMTGWKVICPK